MTDFKFGDVVLVPFPFSDQISTKKRPAVIVSSPAYHQSRPDLILMAITSQTSLSPRMGDTIGKPPVCSTHRLSSRL
jgi:mRNA interferase MazF